MQFNKSNLATYIKLKLFDLFMSILVFYCPQADLVPHNIAHDKLFNASGFV